MSDVLAVFQQLATLGGTPDVHAWAHAWAHAGLASGVADFVGASMSLAHNAVDTATAVASLHPSPPPVAPSEGSQMADQIAGQMAGQMPNEMPEWFLELLPYGPWAIFALLVLSGVGLHISEDFILIPAGFFAATTDKLPLWETLVLAYFGLIIGDLLWIAVCRRFGTRFIQTRWFKRMVHPKRLLQAKHQMEERGIIVVVLARFIPGTRTPVITMAGLLHMPWWKLIAVECATVAVTVPLQTGIGYLAGKGIGSGKSTGELVIWLVALLAITVAVMLAIHWWVQSRSRSGATPRSKVAWLRTFGRKNRSAASIVP
ncbi:MAG: DedA family protein [Phycisphaerae bacterium]|nr:DedA family protein [Phycisphaerae bacterium]